MIEPAYYVIRVEGDLEESWSDYLGGMTITVRPTMSDPVSEIAGELRDQAALHGVLAALYELGLPVLSVIRCLPSSPELGALDAKS